LDVAAVKTAILASESMSLEGFMVAQPVAQRNMFAAAILDIVKVRMRLIRMLKS